jgi:hypothetical protein
MLLGCLLGVLLRFLLVIAAVKVMYHAHAFFHLCLC